MLRIIARQGIQGTPMSQLAKESGVATGTIYHHFKSKEEILNEIYLDKKKDFQVILSECLETDSSIPTQFAALWEGFFRYYMEHPLVFRFSQQLAGTPLITEKTQKAGEAYYKAIFEFFGKGMETGYFLPMDKRMAAYLTHGNIDTLVELCLNRGLEATPEVLQNAIAFSWRAVAVDPQAIKAVSLTTYSHELIVNQHS